MKPLIQTAIILLAMSTAAFATTVGDLSFTLDPPATQVYPTGLATFSCQLNNDTSGACVQFTGALTDIDIDGSFLFLDDLSVAFDTPANAAYFTLPESPGDNTFNNIPQGYEGDADNDPLPNSYSGPIFGLGIIDPSTTPDGIYTGTVTITYDGGDTSASMVAVTVPFTVLITPEPAAGALMIAGLMALIAARRFHRSRPC